MRLSNMCMALPAVSVLASSIAASCWADGYKTRDVGSQHAQTPSNLDALRERISSIFSIVSHCKHDEPDSPAVQPPVPGAKLKQVQVVFRHGARTPLTARYWEGVEWDVCGVPFERAQLSVRNAQTGEEMPNSSDRKRMTDLPGGCKRGQLTMIGHMQALDLGRYLRQRYSAHSDILPAEYSATSVEGRTTNIHRTRDTIHGVLTGLYPSNRDAFTVESCSGVDEVLVANVHNCSRLAALYKSAREHVKQQAATDAQILEVEQRIRGALGLPAADDAQRISWTELHDALTALRAHGKPVPAALTDADLLDINRQATARMLRLVANEAYDDILKLSMGRLLYMMSERFDAAAGADAAPQARLLLWSGHDTTIMPVLVALGQDVSEWPPYISHVILELWEAPEGPGGGAAAADRHYVRLVYNKREIAVPDAPQGRPLTLAEFQAKVLAAYTLSESQHGVLCQFTHDTSLPGVDTSQY